MAYSFVIINWFLFTDIVTLSPISNPAFCIQSPDKISFGLWVGFFQSAFAYLEDIFSFRRLENVPIVIAFIVGKIILNEQFCDGLGFVESFFYLWFVVLVILVIKDFGISFGV